MTMFPERFINDVRDKVSISDIIGQRVKLIRKGGGNYMGLCPFHNEKTPSFSVNESKGFYHCFGCGAHGDVFAFLMNMDKLSFTESIETLAQQAGIPIPQESPIEMRREKQRASLYEVMEKATALYEKQLFLPMGKSALAYLHKRGLTDTDIKHFRLGYATSVGNSLRHQLLHDGCAERDLLELGLVCASKIPTKDNFDYFRDRVMFPILDRRGHPIAFGGRVMGDGEPKYLNSPETPLFHKGENLYALSYADEAIRKTQSVILVEGYMDVIALHKAGILQAVAPLGTALTEVQLALLWKKAPEPVICFDGDKAGQGAAWRSIERALPILTAGKSLQFVFLPDNLDPDEFVKINGREGFMAQIKGARPMSEVIWNKLTDEQHYNTPEKLAGLEKKINQIAEQINDTSVRRYYLSDLRKKLHDFAYEQRTGKKAMQKTIKTTPLPPITPLLPDTKMLLTYLLLYPETAGKYLEDIARLEITDKKALRLLDILTTELSKNPDLTGEEMKAVLKQNYSPNLFIYLQSELEMLGRTPRSPEQVTRDMTTRLSIMQLRTMEKEKSALIQEMNKTNSRQILQQVIALTEEIEKLKQSV